MDAGRTIMDQHYDNQMQLKPSANATLFRGPARQYGSGGVGAFAMRMGRVAVPLIKKYFVPVAKEFGRNLMSSFVPEIPKIVAGKTRPRKALQESLKKSASKTAKATIGRPAPPTSGDRSGGETRRAGGRAIGPGCRTVTATKLVAKRKSGTISNKNVAKRSRSDILSGVAFTD